MFLSPIYIYINLFDRDNTFASLMTLEASTMCVSEATLHQLRQTAKSFSKALQKFGLQLSAADICKFNLIIQCNAHAIKMENGEVIGLGLFPMTCMMNHSCVPNCAHSYVMKPNAPPVLVMRAIRDIAEGEELCYSYVPLYQSTASRRAQLSAAYSFVCNCMRCVGSEAYLLNDCAIDSCGGGEGTDARKVMKSIEICLSVIGRGSRTQDFNVLCRLLAIIASADKAGTLEPCERSMLQSYVCVNRTAFHLADGDTEEFLSSDIGSQLNDIAYGFGALAIGCIYAFTGVDNVEIARIAHLMASCLSKMFSNGSCASDADTIYSSEAVLNATLVALPLRILGKHHAHGSGDSIKYYIECFASHCKKSRSKLEDIRELPPLLHSRAAVECLLSLAKTNYLTELPPDHTTVLRLEELLSRI